MNNIWNVILSSIEDNKIKPSKNNPKVSGKYLCTCVLMWQGEKHKYLQMMEYNADKNYWHDCGNKNGISHNILAWTDNIKPCEFDDFEYIAGGYFIEKV